MVGPAVSCLGAARPAGVDVSGRNVALDEIAVHVGGVARTLAVRDADPLLDCTQTLGIHHLYPEPGLFHVFHPQLAAAAGGTLVTVTNGSADFTGPCPPVFDADASEFADGAVVIALSGASAQAVSHG